MEKLLNITILGIFMFSLISMEQLKFQETNQLQDLITHVKELNKTTQDNSSDFQIVFSDTISILKDISSYHDVTKSSKKDKPETLLRIVKTRLPYILDNPEPIRKVTIYQDIILVEQNSHYQSHVTFPDVPPPDFS